MTVERGRGSRRRDSSEDADRSREEAAKRTVAAVAALLNEGPAADAASSSSSRSRRSKGNAKKGRESKSSRSARRRQKRRRSRSRPSRSRRGKGRKKGSMDSSRSKAEKRRQRKKSKKRGTSDKKPKKEKVDNDKNDAPKAAKNLQDAYSRWWQQQAAMQQEAWAAYYAKQNGVKPKKKNNKSSSSSSSSSSSGNSSSGSRKKPATKRAKSGHAKRERALHGNRNNAMPQKTRQECVPIAKQPFKTTAGGSLREQSAPLATDDAPDLTDPEQMEDEPENNETATSTKAVLGESRKTQDTQSTAVATAARSASMQENSDTVVAARDGLNSAPIDAGAAAAAEDAAPSRVHDSALAEVAEAEGASAADDFEELDPEMLAALLKPRKKRWDVEADTDVAAAAELYQQLRRSKPLYGIQSREAPPKLAGDFWEEPRVKVGLDLLGWLSHIPERWTYPLQDESRRSFAGYLPGCLPAQHCQALFHVIWNETKWLQPTGSQGLPIPRKTAWMISQNCTCRYRYGGLEVDPEMFPPWMVQLMQSVMPACGLKTWEAMPNSCNLNLYEDGTNSVGWHADDEQLFQGRFQDCRIISLSLGARRRFELRLNWPERGEDGLVHMLLGDGDLCTMEGMTQKHFQHRVARETHAVSGPRINLTWRWIAKHSPRCPAGRYRSA